MPRFKRYLSTSAGQPMTDMVLDVPPLSPAAKERLGYPTQKPRTLLKRIVAAFNNEGGLVLDPFCGCGTTSEAARRLKRRWIGIDISPFAIDLVRHQRLKDPSVPTLGIPLDLGGARKLAGEQPFNFEAWAVSRLPAFAPNTKQHGDGGIDGRATLASAPDDIDSRLALAQVKGGKFSVSYLRDFRLLRPPSALVHCRLFRPTHAQPSCADRPLHRTTAGSAGILFCPVDRSAGYLKPLVDPALFASAWLPFRGCGAGIFVSAWSLAASPRPDGSVS